MRTDVKALIAALTAERNSIDTAITALRAMSDGAAPQPVKKRHGRGRTPGFTLSPEQRASIGAAMRARWAARKAANGAETDAQRIA